MYKRIKYQLAHAASSWGDQAQDMDSSMYMILLSCMGEYSDIESVFMPWSRWSSMTIEIVFDVFIGVIAHEA